MINMLKVHKTIKDNPYVSTFYWLSYFNTSDCNLVCCWARAIFGMYYLKTQSFHDWVLVYNMPAKRRSH